jgi:peptidylprolyl isomerase
MLARHALSLGLIVTAPLLLAAARAPKPTTPAASTTPAAATAAASPAPSPVASAAPAASSGPTMADVLAASTPADWQRLDPENTLYVELPTGRVVIALAPAFAPNHVANVKALAREHYYDGLAIVRAQDNYVVQWGDPHGDDPKTKRAIKTAKESLHAEMDRPLAELPFTRLADGDVYAPEVGHALGFPAARDPKRGRAWLTHCYAMVGAGRGDTADSGSGAELYVVIGHSPRHLDRNVTLLGRVVQGMELLSTQPRGGEALGFYKDPVTQGMPLRTVRVAADVPPAERTDLEVLRTDTPTFEKLTDAKRFRRESWFLDKVGHVELCNVPLPVRPVTPATTPAH